MLYKAFLRRGQRHFVLLERGLHVLGRSRYVLRFDEECPTANFKAEEKRFLLVRGADDVRG